MICPRCRSADCYRSHRGSVRDYICTAMRLRPWRCHTCEVRFYAWRVAFSFSVYAHCHRCGNFDLEHIARDRVDPGLLALIPRFLGFPAYRCDPCRERFFSVLPFRRILPSVLSAVDRQASAF